MSDSVSDKESSFEFVDDSDASDREMEQVLKDQIMKPAQTVARKRTSQVSTAPSRATAPPKTPPTATKGTSNFKANVALLLLLLISCVFLFTVICVLSKGLKRHCEELEKVKSDLQKVIDRTNMEDRRDNFYKIKCLEDIPEELVLYCSIITAQKNIQRLEISNRDKIIEELKNDKRYFQREVSARDEIIKQYEISARDKIIEELENDKRDLQKVIDRAVKKDNFKKIKCLEDIPEELMSHWTPDESKFEGIKEIESFKTANQIFREGRPVFSKLSKGQKIIQLIDHKIPKALTVDNRNFLLMEGSCTYTMYTHKGEGGQVFLKEGLLYIILGAPEEEKIKLVYIMPKEYL